MATTLDTLVVDVLFKGDRKGLRRLERDFDATAKKIGAIGRRMAMMGAGFVAGALGAVATFAKYDEQLAKMRALVGLTADEMVDAQKAIAAVSKETGKSMQDTAEAMFFVTSAGLRGKEAADLLMESGQASVVGLGTVEEMADFASAAMEGFGVSTRNAFDVLTTTVKLGKAETTDFSLSIKQLLPTGKLLGIQLEEIGLIMAGLSLTGPVDIAATQIRGLFSALMKPSAEALKVYEKIGMAPDEVIQSLQGGNFFEGLFAFYDKAMAAKVNLGKLFPNIRALEGFVRIARLQRETFRKFDAQKDMEGALASSYELTQHAGRMLAQTMAQVRNLAIEWGQALTPVVTEWIQNAAIPLLEWVRDLIKQFPGTISAVVRAKVAFGAFGLALWGASKAYFALRALMKASPWGIAATALVGLIKGVRLLTENWSSMRAEIARAMPDWLRRLVGLDGTIELDIDASLRVVGDEIAQLQAAINSGTMTEEELVRANERLAALTARQVALGEAQEARSKKEEEFKAAQARAQELVNVSASKIKDIEFQLAQGISMTPERRAELEAELAEERARRDRLIELASIAMGGIEQSAQVIHDAMVRLRDQHDIAVSLSERFLGVGRVGGPTGEELHGAGSGLTFRGLISAARKLEERTAADAASYRETAAARTAAPWWRTPQAPVIGPTVFERTASAAGVPGPQNQTTIIRQANTINLEGVGLSEEAATNLVASKMAEQTHAAVESATGN